MKCPECKAASCKYNQQRKKTESAKNNKDLKKPRTDFTAKCKKCGWEGEI